MFLGQKGRRDRMPVVALAGNPNTGKSTLFNAITGLKQHTGNWPGKTVEIKWGTYRHRGRLCLLVDLPGTYSILARSPEEGVARDFLLFGTPDVTIVVTDATSLERSLNLALQILEVTPRVVVCVNLVDEAKRRHLEIDVQVLSRELGVPAVATSATRGQGIKDLLDAVDDLLAGRVHPQPPPIYYGQEIESAVAGLLPTIEASPGRHPNPRWLALRLLAGDREALDLLRRLGENRCTPVDRWTIPDRASFSLSSQPR